MVKPQGQIDHCLGFRDDLGAAAEASQIVADVAVVLLDGKRQILAGEQLLFGDEAMVAVPVVRYERAAFDPDFVEVFLTGCIITPAQNPGESSPLERIKRSPKPKFF